MVDPSRLDSVSFLSLTCHTDLVVRTLSDSLCPGDLGSSLSGTRSRTVEFFGGKVFYGVLGPLPSPIPYLPDPNSGPRGQETGTRSLNQRGPESTEVTPLPLSLLS